MALRHVREKTERVLSRLTEKSLVSPYTFSYEMPRVRGQYWEYELSVWEDADTWHNLRCGCFTGQGTFRNRDLGVNTFFENNDRVLDELVIALEAGAFDELIPVLVDAEGLLQTNGVDQSNAGAALNLYSYVVATDEWTKTLCEEYILIIHLDEKTKDRLTIGCQQSERYRIKVRSEKGDAYLNVPFDKVQFFKDHERVENYRDKPYFEYQVALSFAGEDRPYVSKVASFLHQRKVRVFYDEYENVSLWGKDLYVHLDEVYRKRARYCVVFLSCHYRKKLWTNHERESAQARAFQEREEYILPVKIDSTEIPGIKPTIGYVSKLPARELAELIYRKIYGF
ncbi:MAG: TIR domain-containing protein [Syntrophales bacterium]